ncbi:MAG: hypothetical protein IH607_00675, partial [Firmicutes bacterium]|nr:hypothetical protein [Bacillota bacterium]
MKRKTFALLVCLALLVSGLTAAAAQDMETITTVSLKAGPLMAEMNDVAEILDIAAIRIHSMPEGYGAFVLSLNDKDALQSLFKVEQEGVYVQSGVFGAQPLYFGFEDVKNFLMSQMEAYAQATPDAMDMGMLQGMMDGSLTEEQMFGMMGVDEDLLTLMNDFKSKKVEETGTFTLQGSDTATLKTVMVLTGEDIVRVIDLPLVREQIANQMMMSDPTATQESIDAMVEENISQIKQGMTDSNIEITMTTYTKDGEFIAYTFDMAAAMDDYSGGSVPIGINATLTRTTIDTAKFYQFTLTLSDSGEAFVNQTGSLFMSDAFVSGKYVFYGMPDEPLFEAMLNCDRSQADHATAELSLTMYDGYSGDVQSAYVLFDQRKADNVTDTAIDVYVGGTVEAIKSALNETGLISVKINNVIQPDSGFFTTLQSATPETSVQMLQMTDSELEIYM